MSNAGARYIVMNDDVGVDTGSWALIFHEFNEGQVLLLIDLMTRIAKKRRQVVEKAVYYFIWTALMIHS